MGSQLYTHGIWSVAQYNSNNAWLYNANNGRINNDNKYNTNHGRSLGYDIGDLSGNDEFMQLYREVWAAYLICRKSKIHGKKQLEFEFDCAGVLSVALRLWFFEYHPEKATAFWITEPKAREVIAAEVSDKIVQTWFNEHLKPQLEANWYDPDSYSCRKGKGGLAAVRALSEKMHKETNGFVCPAIIVKRDLRAFFMSIYTEIVERYMVEFIEQNFGEDYQLRNRLIWLARIIYRSTPQFHCELKSHPLTWSLMEEKRIMLNKLRGLPLGNVTSQTAANFITTLFIGLIREKGYEFVIYTDDSPIIVKLSRWDEWRKVDQPEIEQFIKDTLHLEWHKNKVYVQPIEHGVEFLGYKLKFDRILPSDRVVHNFKWKTHCYIEKFAKNNYYDIQMVEDFMAMFNSYMGHLRWCDARKLEKEQIATLRNTKLGKCFNIYQNKIKIKKTYTRVYRIMRSNIIRENQLLTKKAA